MSKAANVGVGLYQRFGPLFGGGGGSSSEPAPEVPPNIEATTFSSSTARPGSNDDLDGSDYIYDNPK